MANHQAEGMTAEELRLSRTLQEIVSGRRLLYAGNRYWAVRFPTPLEVEWATMEYERAYQQARARGVPTESMMWALIRDRGLYSEADDKRLEELGQRIAELRDRLPYLSDAAMEIVQKQLDQLRGEERAILLSRHAFLSQTAEAKAADRRLQFLLPFCVEDPLSGQRIWSSMEDAEQEDPLVIQRVMQGFLEFMAGVETPTVRYLARGASPTGVRWRMMWTAARKTGSPLFDGSIANWDINKLHLVYWSAFYDGVYEHPERPPQRIIENDELLDAWVHEQTEALEKRAREGRQASPTSAPLSAADYDEIVIFDPNAEYSEDDGLHHRDIE